MKEKENENRSGENPTSHFGSQPYYTTTMGPHKKFSFVGAPGGKVCEIIRKQVVTMSRHVFVRKVIRVTHNTDTLILFNKNRSYDCMCDPFVLECQPLFHF